MVHNYEVGGFEQYTRRMLHTFTHCIHEQIYVQATVTWRGGQYAHRHIPTMHVAVCQMNLQ